MALRPGGADSGTTMYYWAFIQIIIFFDEELNSYVQRVGVPAVSVGPHMFLVGLGGGAHRDAGSENHDAEIRVFVLRCRQSVIASS